VIMKRSCFALIELIVVVSIIALLVALVVPVLQNTKEHAKAALCSSNVKQLLLGLFSYETENQTFPYGFDDTPLNPPPGGPPGFFHYDKTGWWWFNFIEDFYKDSEKKKTTIHCPSKNLREPMLKYNILCGNYGVNQSICKSSQGRPSHAEFVGKPLRSSDISRHAETLLIVDSGYSLINFWHATDPPPDTLDGTIIEDTSYIPGLKINKEKDKKLWHGQEQDAVYGRHLNKTVNVGFVDGHISREKADNLLVEKVDEEDYRNCSPLWRPE